jgi:hypothetical protein
MKRKIIIKIVSIILAICTLIPMSGCDMIGLGGKSCSHLITTEFVKKEATCNPRVGLQIAFTFIRLQASF